MSDGITEARRGTYWKNEKYQTLDNMEKRPVKNNKYNHNDSIVNPELYGKIRSTKEIKYDKEFKHMPNQKWHRYVSFIKSGVRILGYALIPFSLVAATIVLIFSEVIGIVEELV